jgi:hypothetical protein
MPRKGEKASQERRSRAQGCEAVVVLDLIETRTNKLYIIVISQRIEGSYILILDLTFCSD